MKLPPNVKARLARNSGLLHEFPKTKRGKVICNVCGKEYRVGDKKTHDERKYHKEAVRKEEEKKEEEKKALRKAEEKAALKKKQAIKRVTRSRV